MKRPRPSHCTPPPASFATFLSVGCHSSYKRPAPLQLLGVSVSMWETLQSVKSFCKKCDLGARTWERTRMILEDDGVQEAKRVAATIPSRMNKTLVRSRVQSTRTDTSTSKWTPAHPYASYNICARVNLKQMHWKRNCCIHWID